MQRRPLISSSSNGKRPEAPAIRPPHHQLTPPSRTSTPVNNAPPNAGPLANNAHRRQGRARNPPPPAVRRQRQSTNEIARPNSAEMDPRTIWSCEYKRLDVTL